MHDNRTLSKWEKEMEWKRYAHWLLKYRYEKCNVIWLILYIKMKCIKSDRLRIKEPKFPRAYSL